MYVPEDLVWEEGALSSYQAMTISETFDAATAVRSRI